MKFRFTMAAVCAALLLGQATGIPCRAERVGDLPSDSNSSPKPAEAKESAASPQPVPAIVEEPLPSGRAVAVQDCAVRFAEEINVPSTEAGLIAELQVSAGQAVTAGAELARLDDRSWKIRSHAAKLRLTAAQEQLTDDLELRFAETAKAEAMAELEAHRSIHNESAGAVPLSNLRRMRLAVERAELEVARAKKNTRQAQIEIDLRAADVAVIEDTLKRLKLTSPLDGVVLQVFKQRGEWVATGDAVLRLARLDRLQVHALLASDQAPPQDCLDQPVAVSWNDPVTGRRQSLRGRVTSVQPQRLAGGRYRIQAEVVNQRTPSGNDWLLHPGTEVEMSVYPLAGRSAKKPGSAVRR